MSWYQENAEESGEWIKGVYPVDRKVIITIRLRQRLRISKTRPWKRSTHSVMDCIYPFEIVAQAECCIIFESLLS